MSLGLRVTGDCLVQGFVGMDKGCVRVLPAIACLTQRP